jgi:hypothetical protein
MAHRTQIMLTDEQYERLRRESRETGLSLAELIRRKVDENPGGMSREERRRRAKAAFGAWRDLPMTGEEYVRQVRGPGFGERLKKLGLDDDR